MIFRISCPALCWEILFGNPNISRVIAHRAGGFPCAEVDAAASGKILSRERWSETTIVKRFRIFWSTRILVC